MTTIEITSRVVCSADPGDPLAEAHRAAAAFPGPLSGPHARRLPPRPAGVLPMGPRGEPRRPGCDPPADRTLRPRGRAWRDPSAAATSGAMSAACGASASSSTSTMSSTGRGLSLSQAAPGRVGIKWEPHQGAPTAGTHPATLTLPATEVVDPSSALSDSRCRSGAIR